MLSFELCQKLRDAGFPFIRIPSVAEGHRTLVIEGDVTYFGSVDLSDGCPYWIPTLSELIEACGDEFETLNQTPDQEGLYFWYAVAGDITVPSDDRLGFSTPEEAVAQLYLTLHSQPQS